MWIESPPAACHPLVEDGDGALIPDESTVVELYPLRPDLPVEAFLAWTGGEQLLVGGTTAVLLPGTRPAKDRLVGLGDYAARADGKVWAEKAAGIASRYTAP
ncbi:MAG: hypothetical protein L0I24_10880 [Pseudonocardia sp.]|nr:hypothetical protein [Pseudonocardia sp.]